MCHIYRLCKTVEFSCQLTLTHASFISSTCTVSLFGNQAYISDIVFTPWYTVFLPATRKSTTSQSPEENNITVDGDLRSSVCQAQTS